VYVVVHATELDFWTSDDSFISPFYTYYPHDNWGARAEYYEGSAPSHGGCNDAMCRECGADSVWARWRITKAD
jgi:hypothetical protein